MRLSVVIWSGLVRFFVAETPILQPQCLSEWPELIIRTTESIRNGAEFLDSQEGLSQEVTSASIRKICEHSSFLNY